MLTGGPTLAAVGRAAGVRIPAGGARHQVVVTEPHPDLAAARLPMVFDVASGIYWRPCEGTCDAEDLPLDRCAKRVSIHTAARGASETVSAAAVFKGGEPCTLRVSSDWPPQAVISARAASLKAARGPYCRPSPKTCLLPASQPSTKRRLPVRAGTPVTIDLKVPRQTAANIGTCHDIKLTITYAGPGVRRGVKAVFGFDLRLAG